MSTTYRITSTILDPRDSLTINIFGANETYIPIYSTANKVIRGLNIYVGTQKDINVLSVSCLDGTHFRVVRTEPAAMPFRLSPGGHFVVWLEFDAGLGGIYEDQLVITTEDAITTLNIPIQGVRATTASVNNQADENVVLHISENPSSDNCTLTLSGGRIQEAAIYDMLGKVVARLTNTNNWTWDLRGASGERVADGTYFVRAQGIIDDGRVFVKTEKMIIQQ
jgi:hypothetical protein